MVGAVTLLIVLAGAQLRKLFFMQIGTNQL